jgi:cell division protein FtsL
MTPPAAAAAAPAPSTRRARVVSPPRPSVAPRNPRRVSGPARPARRPGRPPAPSVQAERGLALGVLEALRGLAGNRSLDRLIRSRTWIALITFALLGIVTLQLLVLRLNANIGHALVRESQLQRENAALSIEGSELASGERVEFQAAHLGMQLVPEGSLRFLTSDPSSDIARAAAALKAPVHAFSTNPSSSAPSTTAASASTTESSEAPSGEATAGTNAPVAQASTETETPAAGANGSTDTGETATGAEAPAGETPTSTPSSSAAATATGAAEAAVGGVGAAG